MGPRLTLLVAAKLHANQLERHLELFEYIDEVERVLVVRHAPLKQRLSKVENVCFRDGSRVGNAYRMAQTVRDCLSTRSVDLVVGFNPVPWGSVAAWVAGTRGTKTCLSLIGMDYQQVQKPWGRPFLSAVKGADAVTVTGAKMAEGLARLGVSPRRIRVLPHSVDTARFVPCEGKRTVDVISVGQLIERKRMDIVIDAVSLLKERGTLVQLALLGEGPLETTLRAQAKRLGVQGQVTFLGYRDDVETVLSSARVFCLASEWEGVPFAMMEAMASGLVPVVTDVGTIADWVKDGENGRIIRGNDPAHLAETLGHLLSGREEFDRLQGRVIAERTKLSFEHGAQIWSEILKDCLAL